MGILKPIFMNSRKINLSFGKLTDANFENKGNHIVASMDSNPAFTNPVPAITEVKAAANRYSAALVAAANLGRNEVAEKNASRSELEQLLATLGLYVMNTAKGDEKMLVSSGFTLTKQREPRHISTPGNVTISNGISQGELIATIKGDPGATCYIHQICSELPTDATIWQSVNTSTSKYMYKHLQPGRQYWVRVAVVGARQQIAYSPVATKFAQ